MCQKVTNLESQVASLLSPQMHGAQEKRCIGVQPQPQSQCAGEMRKLLKGNQEQVGMWYCGLSQQERKERMSRLVTYQRGSLDPE